MKECLLILLLATIMLGCKEEKKTMKGDDIVTVANFIEFFPLSKLPFQISDTSLVAKTSDSLLISQKIISQFIHLARQKRTTKKPTCL
jgi:hypothetical protein